jgi:hypothetical protein
MTLRNRLDRLEKTSRPRVSFWDALVGAADPAELSAADRRVYDELTAPADDEPDTVEDLLGSLAASAGGTHP